MEKILMKSFQLILVFFISILGFGQTTISVRNAHSMAYNAVTEKIYLFGGADEEKVLSDLWVFNNDQWERIETKTSPNPRTFAVMGYDPVKEGILLFGGNKVLFGKTTDSQNLLNDTWLFKNGEWKQIVTENAPIPRAEASLAYDETRNRWVLFGGYTIEEDKYVKLGDTWEFYEDNWHRVSGKGPSQRHGASMVYNNGLGKIMLFGGSTVDKQYGDGKGETWVWNGETWNRLIMDQPNGVFNAAMGYDPVNEEIVRFGGWNGTKRVATTWVFENNAWNSLKFDEKPPARNHSNMVYDAKNQRMILFGGHDGEFIFGDTWEFKNDSWHKIQDHKPLKRKGNGH